MDQSGVPGNTTSEHDADCDLLKTELPGKPGVHVHAKTPVLHRLISSWVVRPLWDYRSDSELLQGFLDALNAHELLWKQQIIASAINAESILLAEDPDALGVTGFLGDMEAAHLPPDAELLEPEHISSAAKYEDNLQLFGVTEVTTRGRMALSGQGCAAVTGNPQFMAIELLPAAITSQTVQRTAEHDIESLTWVLGYCMLRKLYNKTYAIQNDGAEHTFMKESFSAAFGKLSIKDIWASRQAATPFNWCDEQSSGDMEPFFQTHISQPLRGLLEYLTDHTFQRQVKKRALQFDDITPGQPLTYGMLRKRLRWVIEVLQKDPSLDPIH